MEDYIEVYRDGELYLIPCEQEEVEDDEDVKSE